MSKSKPRFTLGHSPHGMLCVSMVDPTKEERWFWQRALRANHREDRFYVQRQKAVKTYIDWCNSVFDAEVARARKYI